MIIRRAGIEDSSDIADLVNRAFYPEYEYFDQPTTSTEQIMQGLEGGDTWLVGEEGDDADRRIVAGVCIHAERMDDNTARVGQLAVEPSSRGHSYGAKLMTAAEARLREEGCAGVTIGVLSFKTHLPLYYGQLGYVLDPTRRGDPEPTPKRHCFIHIMTKAL